MNRCQCVCDTCQSDQHCDTATCALPDPPKFLVGQRVIGIRDRLLAGYYGHIVEFDEPYPQYVIVNIKGRIVGSDDRNAGCVGSDFPFMPSEIQAAD